MKADEKVILEGNKKEKFTHFEFLEAKVDALEDALNEIVEILRYNGLHREEKIEPKYFDLDEAFKKLED